MGLGTRLSLIIVTINIAILVIVAFLANFSSRAALRTEALNRFEQKSEIAFENVDAELTNFVDFAEDIADNIAIFDNLDNDADLSTHLQDLWEDDARGSLVYTVTVFRPDAPVFQMDSTGEIADSGINETSPAVGSNNPVWFTPDITTSTLNAGAVISVAFAYEHESGNGVVQVNMLHSQFQQLVLSSLNADGLLLETINGYIMILDESGKVIDTENMQGETEDLADGANLLRQSIEEAERTPEGLFEIEDPFNDNQIGLVASRDFTTTGWQFIALFPESEIPVLPADVYIPIAIVGIVGIIVLIQTLNQFIDNAIVKPLKDLGRSASEIGEGNLRFIVFHKDKTDEIGQLATAMDRMRSHLRQTYDELQTWSHTLEERVDDRTEQLREARKDAETTARQLQVVYDESLSVVNEAQLQPVLDTFIDRILMLLNATYCAVWLLEEDFQHVRQVVTNDTRRRTGSGGAVMMLATQGIVGQAIQNDKPVIVDDYANYEHRVQLAEYYVDTTPPFSRGMCAPLQFAGFAIGAVVVGRDAESDPFNSEAQRQLTLFTNMVSPSVRNAQLFNELQKAVREAKRANEVKTRFLASVTHELRTPLNLIINNMDFMRVGAFGDVTEEQISRLNQTVRSAEHLLYLINDLLDVSKIDAGEMQLFIQKQDLYIMLEDAVDNAYALLDSYDDKKDNLELKVDMEDELPEIPIDARRIRQVLNNLLSNGIKFTKKGTVTLKVFATEAGVHFSVHDTGMGIPANEMKKLFQAFERTNAAKQHAIEGTGLGLPISRYLVQQHGGDISVTSDVGVGTTFAFTLPLDADETKTLSLSDTQQIMAILTVDDEEE